MVGISYSHKILSATEQRALVKSWQTEKNKNALNTLVLCNIKAVTKQARLFHSRNGTLHYDDLLQEGLGGLVKAANMFDDTKNVTFLSYALLWVKANMRRHVMDHKSIVRLGTTRIDRKLFSNIGNILSVKDESYDDSSNITKAAKALGCSADKIKNMATTLRSGDVMLDAPSSVSEDGLLIDRLGDSFDHESSLFDSYQTSALSEAVREIVDTLPESEKKIIYHRFMCNEPKTLRDLAEDMNISREWVRKVETRALSRIKKRLVSQHNIKELN